MVFRSSQQRKAFFARLKTVQQRVTSKFKPKTAAEQASELQSIRVERVRLEGIANIQQRIQEERSKQKQAQQTIAEAKRIRFEASTIGRSLAAIKKAEVKFQKVSRKFK